MHELSVLAAANEAPTRDCVIANNRVWTYADMATRVRTALGSLRAQGVQLGDRVALTPDVDVDSIVWLYALFELGCPAVLLHPRLTDRERAIVLGEAQPTHVALAASPAAPGYPAVRSSRRRPRTLQTSDGFPKIGGCWACLLLTSVVCRL
jgi:acyl-CoA synthetase (AMP-forming)/AMP-acid ligase II